MELTGTPTAEDLDDIQQVFEINMRAMRRYAVPPFAVVLPGASNTPDHGEEAGTGSQEKARGKTDAK